MEKIEEFLINFFGFKEKLDEAINLNKALIQEKEELKESFDYQIEELQEDIDNLNLLIDIPDERETYYTEKWKHSPITYKAQYGLLRDVRTFLPKDSCILMEKVKRNNLDLGTDDEKVLKILKYVHKVIKYTGDNSTHNVNEFWQHPEETIQSGKGDCEDMSLLIKALCNLAGVPDYKVKVCAGWVEYGSGTCGHCYCIYLRDNDTWCVLDGCYYYTTTAISKRIEHKEDTKYNPKPGSIWWTFTQKYSYAQRDTAVLGRVNQDEPCAFKLKTGKCGLDWKKECNKRNCKRYISLRDA